MQVGRKQLLYLNGTWVDANLMFSKCWQNTEAEEITTSVNASNRLTVVHLSRYGGYAKGCEIMYKGGKASGSYHRLMNSDNFEN
jgi:hypothetical protein